MSSERIAALQEALKAAPDSHPLRLMLAEALAQAGQTEAAIGHYEILLNGDRLPREGLVLAGSLALQANRPDLAERCLARALERGVIDGTAALRARLDAWYVEQGMVRVQLPLSAGSQAVPADVEQPRSVTFADVGGLAGVKKLIHRLIILPQMRPELYQRYGRRSGGGVLLFGPPGCGKTLLARATAGECQLPFLNIRIEEILDPYFGASERNLHGAFVQARSQAPCVLFIDELDALAYARRKLQAGTGRSLVDQLLQEMDAIGAENPQILIMAATNAPWDVDDALMRPGRFDRRIFVPPPDEAARVEILRHLLELLPSEKLDLPRLAKETALFSGADLKALVEGAVDEVIEEALETQGEPPIAMRHLEQVRAGLRPTTVDWLNRARHYVQFANQDERYNDVAALLGTREVREHL